MPENTPAPTPHRAIYGFAVFLLFKTFFFIYLFWAFVPDEILEHMLGLTYMPNKYFALFIPVLVSFGLVIFGIFIYPAMNLALTHAPTDIRTIRDRFTIRRCHWICDGGRACDRKVTFDSSIHGTDWSVPEFCEFHIGLCVYTADEVKISNYCDCSDRKKCMIAMRPSHVVELHGREMVPSASDLDISDVCKRMFLKTKEE